MRWTKRCANCKRFIKYKCKKCDAKISLGEGDYIRLDNFILFLAISFCLAIFVLLILSIMKVI